MKVVAKSLLIILIAFLWLKPLEARAGTTPIVKVGFDKPYFSRSERFTATGYVTNATTETFRYTKLTLSIYQAIASGDRLFGGSSDRGRPIIRQTWFKTLAPGLQQVSLARDIQSLKLPEGVYPAEFSLTLANSQTYIDRAFLVIVEPKDRPLAVAFVWNLHQSDRRLPGGTFSDNKLYELIDPTPEKPGPLSQQLAAISEDPRARATMATGPILIEQLTAMAQGYVWREKSKTRRVNKDAPEAQAARSWLERLKSLSDSGQVEILTSPYGHAPLPLLADWGWNEDIAGQFRLARAVGDNARLKQANGVYLPALALDNKTARLLAEANFSFAVARFDRSDATAAAGRVYSLGSGQDKLAIFNSDSEISDWLSAVSADKAGTELVALLAQRLLSSDPGSLVVISPTAGHWLPGKDLLRQLYQALSQTAWISPVHLSSFDKTPASPADVRTPESSLTVNDAYRKNLRRSRSKWRDFAAGVSRDNRLRRLLERQLYVAQSVDFLLEPADSASIGRLYIDHINQTIESEFNKIELAPPPKISFSTRTGKIPVAIINRTEYPIRARLVLSGKDFIFPDDKKDKVVLMPKDNLFSYDITAGFLGLKPLNVKVFIGDREIANRQIEVAVSSLLRYLVVSATTLLIVGATVVIFWRRRHKRNEIGIF